MRWLSEKPREVMMAYTLAKRKATVSDRLVSLLLSPVCPTEWTVNTMMRAISTTIGDMANIPCFLLIGLSFVLPHLLGREAEGHQ